MAKTRATMIVAFLLLGLTPVVHGSEKLDRGFTALPAADGSVFLSWRLLRDDPADMTFHLHGQGMAGDILAEHPGMEVLASELQDHLYRMGVVAQTMGYYYPAQLGGK